MKKSIYITLIFLFISISFNSCEIDTSTRMKVTLSGFEDARVTGDIWLFDNWPDLSQSEWKNGDGTVTYKKDKAIQSDYGSSAVFNNLNTDMTYHVRIVYKGLDNVIRSYTRAVKITPEDEGNEVLVEFYNLM